METSNSVAIARTACGDGGVPEKAYLIEAIVFYVFYVISCFYRSDLLKSHMVFKTYKNQIFPAFGGAYSFGTFTWFR
jgi:hypothetical protein